jgi:hypothetical protein
MWFAAIALTFGTAEESILRARRSGVLARSIPQIHEGYRSGAIKGNASTLLGFASVTAAVAASSTGYWPG